jgi:hypothetical protein
MKISEIKDRLQHYQLPPEHAEGIAQVLYELVTAELPTRQALVREVERALDRQHAEITVTMRRLLEEQREDAEQAARPDGSLEPLLHDLERRIGGDADLSLARRLEQLRGEFEALRRVVEARAEAPAVADDRMEGLCAGLARLERDLAEEGRLGRRLAGVDSVTQNLSRLERRLGKEGEIGKEIARISPLASDIASFGARLEGVPGWGQLLVMALIGGAAGGGVVWLFDWLASAGAVTL